MDASLYRLLCRLHQVTDYRFSPFATTVRYVASPDLCSAVSSAARGGQGRRPSCRRRSPDTPRRRSRADTARGTARASDR